MAEVVRSRDKRKGIVYWENPEVVGRYGEYRMVRLTHPKDLETWGRLMAHCAGHHTKWIADTPIWHFLTLLDKYDVPHVTIHAKAAEWINKPHPDDTKAGSIWNLTLPVMSPAPGWCSSTAYDSGRTQAAIKFPAPVMIAGQECLVLSAYDRGHQDATKYEAPVMAWYQEAMRAT